MHPGIDGAGSGPPRSATVDTREAQCARVADFLETRPDGATRRELDAACDAGCTTKVLSDMPRLGYTLRKGWGRERCAAGTLTRSRVRVYMLLSRPDAAPRQQCLDLAIEGRAE
jgi:hypothetical protein